VANAVNCTAAPNCTALHRGECLTTDQSCGPCVENYIGDYGDQNTPCIPLQALENANNRTTLLCSSFQDCPSWQRCKLPRGECVTQSKSCFASCSNHGECIYTSTSFGKPIPEEECTLDNFYCAATCACEDGYSGRYCEISDSTLKQRRALRSKLIAVMEDITASDDINEQSIEAWSASLFDLSIKPFEMSANDAAGIASIANRTLNYALELGIESHTAMLGVLRATDTVSSVRTYNYNPNEYDSQTFNTSETFVNNTARSIVQVTSRFADLIGSSLILGEKEETYCFDNFRLSSAVHAFPDANVSSTLLLSSPQTEFEKQTAAAASTVELIPVANASAASTLTVNFVTVYPRAYAADTSAFYSDPIYLQVQADRGSSGGSSGSSGGPTADEVLSSIVLTFQHNAETVETTASSSNSQSNGTAAAAPGVVNVTSQCLGLSLEERYRHTCPGSNAVIWHNCSGKVGQYVSYCPVPATTCGVLDVDSATIASSDACTVLSTNSTTTVCRCEVRPAKLLRAAAARRRLSGTTVGGGKELSSIMDETGVTSMVVTSEYVASGFADTFNGASKFDETAFVQVLTVFIMFAALWGGAFILLFAFSLKGKTPAAKRKINKRITAWQTEAEQALAQGQAASPSVDPKACFLNYVDKIFPSVYSANDQKSGISRMLGELRQHHRYLTMLEIGNDENSMAEKAVIVLKVLSIDTMQMFLLAVLYDLESPDDDGSCEKHTTESSCLSRTSVTDSSQSYCQWELQTLHGEEVPDSYACSYQQPQSSVRTFIYILVFISIVTALINTPIDYLFTIMTAPLENEVQKSARVADAQSAVAGSSDLVQGRVAAAVRRFSVSAQAVAGQVRRQTAALLPAVSRANASASASASASSRGGGFFNLFRKKDLVGGQPAVVVDREIPGEVQHVRTVTQTHLTRWQIQAAMLRGARQREANFLQGFVDTIVVPSPPSSSASSRKDAGLRPAEAVGAGAGATASVAGSAVPAAVDIESQVDYHSSSARPRLTADELFERVVRQRLLLKSGSPATALYDAQWGVVGPLVSDTMPLAVLGHNNSNSTIDDEQGGGIGSGGGGSGGGKNSAETYEISAQAREVIAKDIADSDEAAAEYRERLSHYTTHHAGLTVLHLFILDVLGRRTPAAKIFSNKFDENFSHTAAVGYMKKAVTLMVIIGLNVFFVYYALLRAYQKGRSWQNNYVIACIAQMVVEIVLNETVECLWLNYFVPNMVRAEVLRATVVLTDIAEELSNATVDSDARRGRYFLDAPSYLFTSSKLAHSYPALLESTVVLSYKSHLPGEISKTWPHVQRRIDENEDQLTERRDHKWWWALKKWTLRAVLALSTVVAISLVWLGSFNFQLQRLIVRFLQPLLFTGIMLLFILASTNKTALGIVIILLVFIGTVILWNIAKQRVDPAPSTLGEIRAEIAAERQEASLVTFKSKSRSRFEEAVDNELLAYETAYGRRHGHRDSSGTSSSDGGGGGGSSRSSHRPSGGDSDAEARRAHKEEKKRQRMHHDHAGVAPGKKPHRKHNHKEHSGGGQDNYDQNKGGPVSDVEAEEAGTRVSSAPKLPQENHFPSKPHRSHRHHRHHRAVQDSEGSAVDSSSNESGFQAPSHAVAPVPVPVPVAVVLASAEGPQHARSHHHQQHQHHHRSQHHRQPQRIRGSASSAAGAASSVSLSSVGIASASELAANDGASSVSVLHDSNLSISASEFSDDSSTPQAKA
jgi:hypothetical protein